MLTTRVKVDLSRWDSEEVLYIYAGNFGFPISKDRIREIVQGVDHEGNISVEHLLRNVIIRARQAGVTLANIKTQLANAVENVDFQV